MSGFSMAAAIGTSLCSERRMAKRRLVRPVTTAQGLKNARELTRVILAEGDETIPACVRTTLAPLVRQLHVLDQEIACSDRTIAAVARDDEMARRLMTILPLPVRQFRRRRFLLEYADFLESHIERWTVTRQGFLVSGIKRDYVRINPAGRAPHPRRGAPNRRRHPGVRSRLLLPTPRDRRDLLNRRLSESPPPRRG